MNYIERNKLETIYKDDYTDFTRLSDFEIFTKDILVSLKKLNIIETKRKYEEKYAFINIEKGSKPLSPLSLFIAVDDTCNFLKKVATKKEYCIKLNYIYYPHNKCQNVIPFNFNDNSYAYNKNVTIVNSFYCLHGNLNCPEIVLFPARTFPIQLNEYVELEIIDRSNPEEEQYIVIENHSISNLILNALKQALSELEISLPTFVVMDKNCYIYHGHFYTSDYTYFQCVNPYIRIHRKNNVEDFRDDNRNGIDSGSSPLATSFLGSTSSRDIINERNNGRLDNGNYISLYKGTGFEVNYNSFKFFNYFKCFSYDQLVSLFSLFIYLSNLKGKNIYKINMHIKNIYLIDKPHCCHMLRSMNLKNKKYDILKMTARKRKKRKKEIYKNKKIYVFTNRYKKNCYNKNVFQYIYLNNIHNCIKKKKFYGRRIFLCCFVKDKNNIYNNRNDCSENNNCLKWVMEKCGGMENGITIRNYLFNVKNDVFNKPSYYYLNDYKKIKLLDILSDDAGYGNSAEENENFRPDYSDSSLLFYPRPTITYSSNYESNEENGKSKRKSTFEEINRLYKNLRNQKNFSKNENNNPFVSIYVLNFISNMEHKILGKISQKNITTNQNNTTHNLNTMGNNLKNSEQEKKKKKKKIMNVWKIRFINNDKYKGKNSYLLKNILRLYYNELLELKKKRNNNNKCYSNGMMPLVQHYLMEYISLKNKEWLRDGDIGTYSCFNIEEDSTRYYIDKVLNNMFSSNKKRIYEWPRGKKMHRNKFHPRRVSHSSLFSRRSSYDECFYDADNAPMYIGATKGIANSVETGVENSIKYSVGNGRGNNPGNSLFIRKVDGELFPQTTNSGYNNLYQNKTKEVYFVLKKGDNFSDRINHSFLEKKGKNGKEYIRVREKNVIKKRQKYRNNEKSTQRNEEKGAEIKLEEIVTDFLKIKEKYFLCHHEEKITILFFYLISHASNIKTFYYIWNQFFDNIRNKYENNEYIFSDYLYLSYGPLNIYSYSCSILSQYIKALNISTQQFKINEMKDHLKQKKTLSFFCNDSDDNSLLKDNSNYDSLSNINENEPLGTASQSKSNSISTFFRKNTSDENVFYSCEMNDSSSFSNKRFLGSKNENSSSNLEADYSKGSLDSIPRSCQYGTSEVVPPTSIHTSGSASCNENNYPTSNVNINQTSNVNINTSGNSSIADGGNVFFGKTQRQSGSGIPIGEKNNLMISNFFPYPLNNMELFITKNNGGTKDVNDQDDMITLIHELLKNNNNKDIYNYNDFIKWYRNNIGNFIYTSQNVLKHYYRCIKDSYFVNVDLGYIKEKCKEIEDKYYKKGSTISISTIDGNSCVGMDEEKDDYLKRMFDYVKNNYSYIKKIKCPLNTFFVGELNLDNLLNLNIIDLLDCAFKVFFISYINSIMNSKLIYIRKIQEILSKMFSIIKHIHRKKKKKKKKKSKKDNNTDDGEGGVGEDCRSSIKNNSNNNHTRNDSNDKTFLKHIINKSNSSELIKGRERYKNDFDDNTPKKPSNLIIKDEDNNGSDVVSHLSKLNGEVRDPTSPAENTHNSDFLMDHRNNSDGNVNLISRKGNNMGEQEENPDGGKINVGEEGLNGGNDLNQISPIQVTTIALNNTISNNIKTQENANDSERNSSDNVDFCFSEEKAGYKNSSFNINKEENYFKNYSVDTEKKKKKTSYDGTDFSEDIKRIYKNRYKIIFNKKLFLLFEKCEEVFNKAVWLYRIFNNNLNEKIIFNLINTILESEEKEIIIKPKYEKYFYNFIKNIYLNESSKNNVFDKKGSSSSSKFQKINKSISSKNLNKTLKSKSSKNPKNNVINNPYQSLGISVKIKKNESQASQTGDEKNIISKDKLSLLLHSYNKEQNIQECIIDYVDYSFSDTLYNTPSRMYCSVNPMDTTVSFVKTTSIL
ncbi:hypothetical protein, conserved [Plasmodium gonderi]|uniref:Uncharacterized protein n=1 Tax=Plasmodium gonderi TaxID=77519 RepID=A0A1Y1JKB0_PLAGO|nr:hypothetical protein, conserved [Plasmodium gonderi]GAW82966.1 hypothetical protein, conserved [Plasmodium gonderi]